MKYHSGMHLARARSLQALDIREDVLQRPGDRASTICTVVRNDVSRA